MPRYVSETEWVYRFLSPDASVEVKDQVCRRKRTALSVPTFSVKQKIRKLKGLGVGGVKQCNLVYFVIPY